MTELTEDEIKRLAGWDGTGPVASVYLDVDGRRWPKPQECLSRFDRLSRAALDRAGSGDAGGALQRVRDHLEGLDRSHTRGLAAFASADGSLWKVIELAVPVRDQVVLDAVPHVRQLEAVVDTHEPLGVLLVDRQRIRMFRFELGELRERSELVEAVERDEPGGSRDRGHDRDHLDPAVHQHVRHAARVAFELHQRAPIAHLVLGAPEDLAGLVEKELHPYLRDRIAARLAIPVSAPDAAIVEAARDVQESVERAKELALVARLRDAVHGGRPAVAGVEAVLGALGEHRVDTLVVSDGFEAPGWRCSGCQHLLAKAPAGRSCPRCAGTLAAVDDVVEDAVEHALLQSCRVHTAVGNADLDVLGGVGALLRY